MRSQCLDEIEGRKQGMEKGLLAYRNSSQAVFTARGMNKWILFFLVKRKSTSAPRLFTLKLYTQPKLSLSTRPPFWTYGVIYGVYKRTWREALYGKERMKGKEY